MNGSVRSFGVVVCLVGLGGCGSVTSNPGGGDGGVDAGAIDGQGSDTPPPSEFLSCIQLPAKCGAGANDSCCNSPEIPAGTYLRSFDHAGDPNSGNTNFPATVSDFRLDKYEVTVGRFRAFVNAGMGTQSSPPVARVGAHEKIVGSGWDADWNASLAPNTVALIAAVKCDPTLQTWTDTPGTEKDETRPMNCVTWFDAMAFCAWDGGYLPTEAEWNFAATGGDQQRAFPWSSPAASLTLDPSYASYFNGTDCVGDGMAGCQETDLVPVGTKPAGDGRWFQSDLAGNVTEWVLDWASAYATPCTDCANLVAAAKREMRGGNFNNGQTLLRTGFRINLDPSNRNALTGIRCARPSALVH